MGIFQIFNSKNKFYLHKLNELGKSDDGFLEFLKIMVEDIQKKPNLIKTFDEIKTQIFNVLITLIKNNVDIDDKLSLINDLIYSTNEMYESLGENSKELEHYEEFIFKNATSLISEVLSTYKFSFKEEDVSILETISYLEHNLNYMAEAPTSVEEMIQFGIGKYQVLNFEESIYNNIENSILNNPSIEKIKYLNEYDVFSSFLNRLLPKMYEKLGEYELDIVYVLCLISPNIKPVVEYIKTINEQSIFDFFHNNLINIFYKSNIFAYIEILNHKLNSKDIMYYSNEIEKIITNSWNEDYYILENIFMINDIEKIISKSEQREIKAQIGNLKHQSLIKNELKKQSDISIQTKNIASEANKKAERAEIEASIANKKVQKALKDASFALTSSLEARNTAYSAQYIAERK